MTCRKKKSQCEPRGLNLCSFPGGQIDMHPRGWNALTLESKSRSVVMMVVEMLRKVALAVDDRKLNFVRSTEQGAQYATQGTVTS